MKKSKKRWAWSKKELRKATQGSTWRRTAPAWYCKFENKINKTKTKRALHRLMLDYDMNFLEFGKINHRHSAGWLWD